MVIKCPRKYKTHVKAKKGQILLLTLVTMALGLIVISPLLSFLNDSSTTYLHEVIRASAYYTADAMMENVLSDVYSGVDIYSQNLSTQQGYGQQNYLNTSYDVNVLINYSTTQPLPTPQGVGDWLYLDPGISNCNNSSSCNPDLLLGSLAVGKTHNFTVYLSAGDQVQVNWTLQEAAAPYCAYYLIIIIPVYRCCPDQPYHCEGSMQMLDQNNQLIQGTNVSGFSDYAPLTLNFGYSVKTNGNYTIQFTNNNSWRWEVPAGNLLCQGTYTSPARPVSAVFSGSGETDHTWVRIGKPTSGQVYSYQDYTITATAKKSSQKIVSITAAVRQSPGPLAWWREQTVDIPSWQVTYYY